jgi:hypothetical protein
VDATLTKKAYPFDSKNFLLDGHALWRRLSGRGMVIRRGTLSNMRRFSLEEGSVIFETTENVFLSSGRALYELTFAEEPGVIQGYIHTEKTINRVKNKERVGIQVDPKTLWIRKIWPLDRKLKWYQF